MHLHALAAEAKHKGWQLQVPVVEAGWLAGRESARCMWALRSATPAAAGDAATAETAVASGTHAGQEERRARFRERAVGGAGELASREPMDMSAASMGAASVAGRPVRRCCRVRSCVEAVSAPAIYFPDRVTRPGAPDTALAAHLFADDATPARLHASVHARSRPTASAAQLLSATRTTWMLCSCAL